MFRFIVHTNVYSFSLWCVQQPATTKWLASLEILRPKHVIKWLTGQALQSTWRDWEYKWPNLELLLGSSGLCEWTKDVPVEMRFLIQGMRECKRRNATVQLHIYTNNTHMLIMLHHRSTMKWESKTENLMLAMLNFTRLAKFQFHKQQGVNRGKYSTEQSRICHAFIIY